MIKNTQSAIVNVAAVILMLVNTVQSQTTEYYYTRPDLNIAGYHFNFFGGVSIRSYLYIGEKSINNKDFHEYFNTHTGELVYLHFDGAKVYSYQRFSDKSELIHDFGISVGKPITEGLNTGFSVESIGEITLLTGEVRKTHVLRQGSLTRTWVEGIGDLKAGFLPIYYDIEGSSTLVCVREGETLILDKQDLRLACDSFNCVKALPLFDFKVDGKKVELIDESLFADHYEIDFGDGYVFSDFVSSHEYEKPGCYKVSLKVKSDCSNVTRSKNTYISVCDEDQWTQIQDDGNDSVYRIYAYDEKTIFKYGSGSIEKSTDGGMSFRTFPALNEEDFSIPINIMGMWNKNDGILGANYANTTKNSIYITNDGGETWTPTLPDSYNVRQFKLADNGLVYVADGFYSCQSGKSSDFGQTWSIIETPPNTHITAFQVVSGDTVIASGSLSMQGQEDYILLKSTDGGISWTFKILPYKLNQFQFFNSNVAFAFNFERELYATNDGGDSWSKININVSVHRLFMANETMGWFSDGLKIYYTNDSFKSYNITNCKRSIYDLSVVDGTTSFATEFIYNSNHTLRKTLTYKSNVNWIDTCIETEVVDQSFPGQISIYPSVTQDIIDIQAKIKLKNIQILDFRGVKLIDQVSHLENVTISLSELSSGLYFVRVYDENGVDRVFKVIKM